VVGLLLLTAVLAAAVADDAVAGPHASGAAVRTLRLRLGDRISVKGTPLACVVQNSRGTVNLACVEGSLRSPVPHSYAVGIADKGADLAAVSASGASAKLVTVVQEPSVRGAAFPSPSRGARAFAIAPTAALLVGGTHIFCAVQTTDGTVNVTCGLSSIAQHLQFPAGTYIVSESTRFALLGKTEPKDKFKTVAARSQP
jgi:hypothetical protein